MEPDILVAEDEMWEMGGGRSLWEWRRRRRGTLEGEMEEIRGSLGE